MIRNTALGAAAALTLTVAGGVSALALTTQQQHAQPAQTPTVVIEYVDQFGNPVAAPTAATQPSLAPAQPATVIVVDESGTPLSTITPSQPAVAAPRATTSPPVAFADVAAPAAADTAGQTQPGEYVDEHEDGDDDD